MDSDQISNHSRPRVEAMDALIGTEFKVLDDGFVRVVDYMGSDASIVQAARVSYGRGTKTVHEDRGLIRYLMRHHHTTPFEMCELKLHLRVPMDCWRQWVRHRTANINEYSTRYSIAIDSAQQTPPSQWRRQSSLNRQGSAGMLDESIGRGLSERESALHAMARTVYNERLESGVSREQARKDLPLATYTEVFWKIDLHNLFHFLKLRSDAHAQLEIRAYANTIGTTIVQPWCPLAWEAFEEYRRDSLNLSKLEVEVIQALTSSNLEGATRLLQQAGLVATPSHRVKRSRERDELGTKLALLGLPLPWSE